MSGAEVRPARLEDCAGIAAFRARMEGGGHLAAIRDARFYEHKYLQRGRGLVLEHQGRVAGTIAATPRRVRLGGEVVATADLGDLFVDPELRGRGLFRSLHDHLVAALEADGVRLVTSRPGPAAEPIFREALGYETLLPVKEWAAALDGTGTRALPLGRVPVLRLALPRIRRRPGPLAQIRRAATGSAPRGAVERPASPSELTPPDPFGAGWPAAGTLRDPQWLSDRYATDPSAYQTVAVGRRGQVEAMAVYLVILDAGGGPARAWIVDAWTEGANSGAAPVLCSALVGDLRRARVSVVHFWSAHGPPRGADPIADALRRRGLRGFYRGKQVLYRRVGSGSMPPLPAAREWLFRAGDTDGI